MKASAKLRDGQEPLLRAKIPVDILGFRVWSGVSMGSRDELGLHLSTVPAAGPSCRVTFLPNDCITPVCVMLKAGLRPWGSPSGSCLAISAELKLPTSWSHQKRASFSISLKPRNGDFMLLKSVKGMELPKVSPAGDQQGTGAVSVAELAKAFDKGRPRGRGYGLGDDWVFPPEVRSTTPAFFKGWNVLARTSLPLGQRLSAELRWRMEVPGDLVESLSSASPHKALSRLSLPVLKLDKFSIHGRDYQEKEENSKADQAWVEENEQLNKVAVMCSSIRRQLHLVYSENRVLRNTMEDMRANFNSRAGVEVAAPHADYRWSPPKGKETKEDGSASHKPPAAMRPDGGAPAPVIAKELKKAIIERKST